MIENKYKILFSFFYVYYYEFIVFLNSYAMRLYSQTFFIPEAL